MNNIIHISTEVAPYYKRGGLGDVLAALPKYLNTPEYRNIVFSMYYRERMNRMEEFEVFTEQMNIYGFDYEFIVYTSEISGVEYYFLDLVDQQHFTSLEHANDGNQPYIGSASYMYYLYFAKSILVTLQTRNIQVDHLFCHDWQSTGVFAFQAELSKLKMVHDFHALLIIHNYEFQGDVPEKSLAYLPKEMAAPFRKILDKYDSASMLALGMEACDHIATVSNGYLEELKDGRAPHKMLKFLQDKDNLIALPNGVDYDLWHPEKSPYLSKHYGESSAQQVKLVHKIQLFKKLGFKSSDVATTPLVLILSRLTHQKGIQLITRDFEEEQRCMEVMNNLMNTGIRLIICGTPAGGTSGKLHQRLTTVQENWHGLVYYDPDYSEKKAHEYLSASDMLLVPSLFEPCGLVQIYAMAFGTIPIVRPIGGLRDTVYATDPNQRKNTGFYIDHFSSESLIQSVWQAVGAYKKGDVWSSMMKNAMSQDFSWENSKDHYLSFLKQKRNRWLDSKEMSLEI